MINPIASRDSITIPLSRADDLARVGGIAARFAETIGCPIEVLTIIDPDDDFAAEFRRIGRAVEALAVSIDRPVDLHLVAHENPLESVLSACRHRLVCMATAATPFRNEHYVGSFASALLRESAAPVILVGPSVPDGRVPFDKVVVAVSNEVDERAAVLAGHSLASALDVPLAKVFIDPKGVIYETDYDDLADGLADEVHASMTTGPLDHAQICADLRRTGRQVRIGCARPGHTCPSRSVLDLRGECGLRHDRADTKPSGCPRPTGVRGRTTRTSDRQPTRSGPPVIRLCRCRSRAG